MSRLRMLETYCSALLGLAERPGPPDSMLLDRIERTMEAISAQERVERLWDEAKARSETEFYEAAEWIVP